MSHPELGIEGADRAAHECIQARLNLVAVRRRNQPHPAGYAVFDVGITVSEQRLQVAFDVDVTSFKIDLPDAQTSRGCRELVSLLRLAEASQDRAVFVADVDESGMFSTVLLEEPGNQHHQDGVRTRKDLNPKHGIARLCRHERTVSTRRRDDGQHRCPKEREGQA